MENTSNACAELLDQCLKDGDWSGELLDRAVEENQGRTFLGVVVERLSDAFDPGLCTIYERLMTEAVRRVAPELTPRLQRPGRATAPISTNRIYVLSRVTLGADVAVTSVLMDAAKKRYPQAEIHFVGSRKSYELFETDSRVKHFPAPYARGGSLAERLRSSAELWFEDGLVIDPDSRFTQLGMISVCPPANYLLFPSRIYGGDSDTRLPELAAQWAQEVLGATDAKPYISPRSSQEKPADIAVSLGIGGNAAKGLDESFERALLDMLSRTGETVVVDEGGDDAERERVQRAVLNGIRTHSGSFASFASLIMQSKLYIGYDSAGGHVASACGVPVISIARGFVNQRMAARWRPLGVVIDGTAPDVLDHVRDAVKAMRL